MEFVLHLPRSQLTKYVKEVRILDQGAAPAGASSSTSQQMPSCPPELICPLTHDVFEDPVTLERYVYAQIMLSTCTFHGLVVGLQTAVDELAGDVFQQC